MMQTVRSKQNVNHSILFFEISVNSDRKLQYTINDSVNGSDYATCCSSETDSTSALYAVVVVKLTEFVA